MKRHSHIVFSYIGVFAAGLYVILLFYAAPFSYTGGDFAEYLNAAYRTLHGDMPYLDYWLLFPPLEAYVPALLLKLIGTANLFLYAAVCLKVFNTAIVFMILKNLKVNNTAAFLLSSVLLFIDSTYFYMSVCILSSLFLVLFIRLQKVLYLYIAALLIMLSFGFRSYQTWPFALSMFFLIYYLRQSVTRLHLVLICSIILIAPLIIYYAWLPKPLTALYCVYWDALKHGVSFSIPYFDELKHAIRTIGLYYDRLTLNKSGYTMPGLFFVVLRFMGVCFIYMLPLLALLIYIRQRKYLNHIDKLYLLWGLLFIPYALRFSNLDHIAVSFTPWLVLLLIYAGQHLTRKKELLRYATMFWALFMLLQSYHLYRSHEGPVYEICSNKFSFKTHHAPYAQSISHLQNLIEQNDGDVFLLAWSLPPMYLMTERQNPAYIDSPIDLILASNAEKENRIITSLQKSNVSFIVVENQNITHLHAAHTLQQRAPVLYDYILSYYKLYETDGPYAIYKKQ